MHPAGLAAVQAARANGTWTALDAVETLTEPADLATGLNSDPIARQHWDTFPRSTRRAILEWLSTSRTDTTASNAANASSQTPTKASEPTNGASPNTAISKTVLGTQLRTLNAATGELARAMAVATGVSLEDLWVSPH